MTAEQIAVVWRVLWFLEHILAAFGGAVAVMLMANLWRERRIRRVLKTLRSCAKPSRLLILALAMLCAAPASAQDLPSQSFPAPILRLIPATPPPKLGMSGWAQVIAFGGPVANVVTQELAFAKFGVYDQFIGRRVGMGALNLSLPFLMRWLLRGVPQGTANGQGIVLGAWGAFDAGKNIHVMVTLKVKR